MWISINYDWELILNNLNSLIKLVPDLESIKVPMEKIVETKKEEYFIGHTSNYIKVYIKSNNLNEICNVKLVKIFKDGMLCEIV